MKYALNIIASLGVLALVIWWADTGEVMAQLRDASVTWLMSSVAALTLITVLMVKRWQIVARSFDIDISLRPCNRNGGWGWREGAAAALFPLIGATPSAGIATGVAYGAMMMIAAIPGLFFVWRLGAAHKLEPAIK